MKINRDFEQILGISALLVVILAASIDFIEDLNEGSGLIQIALDVLSNGFVAATLIYILVLRPRATRARNMHLEKAVRYSHEDLTRWKAKASKLLKGLGDKINETFDNRAVLAAFFLEDLLLPKLNSVDE